MTVTFISLFPDFIGFGTMYNTFGWWFASPTIAPNDLIGPGRWKSYLEFDTMHFWFFSQYGLFFYYCWLAATMYQFLIARRPSYEELLLRGVRLHNIVVGVWFLLVIHYGDYAYLGRGGHDFWHVISLDLIIIKAFLLFQVLDMQFFVHCIMLEIRVSYIDRLKTFGSYDTRNLRAKNRQMRETILLNTFFYIQPMICSLYCISPEIWEEDELKLWVLSIYHRPYWSNDLHKKTAIELMYYGSVTDYTPEDVLPNCRKGVYKIMPWVSGERRYMFGTRKRRILAH